MSWKITYDPTKRERTLRERGLDFEDASIVFEGVTADFKDNRSDYGETRMITVGHLRDRMVLIAWTQRNEVRHIISMRKTNEREQKFYAEQLGRS